MCLRFFYLIFPVIHFIVLKKKCLSSSKEKRNKFVTTDSLRSTLLKDVLLEEGQLKIHKRLERKEKGKYLDK